MKIKNEGLKALTVADEQKEIEAVGTGLVLEYLAGSENMGAKYGIDTRLYNVMAPKLPGYVYGKNSGLPTVGRAKLLEYFAAGEVDQAIKEAKTVIQGFGR